MSEFDRNAFEEMYSDADETLDHYDMAKHIYITQQAKIDELQARIDDHDLKLELFINELEKTHREDKDNKIDYWRGFSECADSSIKVFYRDVGFINLKGNKDEN